MMMYGCGGFEVVMKRGRYSDGDIDRVVTSNRKLEGYHVSLVEHRETSLSQPSSTGRCKLTA